MSWGIIIPEVYLNRHSIKMLQTDYEESNDMIELSKQQLLALAVASPREIRDEHGDITQWEEYIVFRFRELMEILEEEIRENYLISIALNSENLTEG